MSNQITDFGDEARRKTPEELLAFLASLGVETATVEHAPVFTVTESKALRGQIEGGHAKNLFLKDKKGRLFLVTALEHVTIDLKRIHERIGASGRVSFAGPEPLLRHWGVTPGSVTPFGALNDRDGLVTVVLDSAMMASPLLNFHPLINSMSTTISPEGLLAFLRASGHEPLVVPVSE